MVHNKVVPEIKIEDADAKTAPDPGNKRKLSGQDPGEPGNKRKLSVGQDPGEAGNKRKLSVGQDPGEPGNKRKLSVGHDEALPPTVGDPQVTNKDKKKKEHVKETAEDKQKRIVHLKEEEALKKREKQLKNQEKLLKKKLAYHHREKTDHEDSDDESICIAPPAPINKISVMMNAVLMAYLFCIALYFPMGFASEFRVTSGVMNHTVITIVMTAGPLFTMIWLFFAIILSTKTKICCSGHSSNWLLRGYYAYSPIFLIFPVLAAFLVIIFLGKMTMEELEKSMFKHLNSYDSNQVSKKYWDGTQNYFKCCGVDKDGWRNWENRNQVEEDIIDWIVPDTCCRKSLKKLDKIKCLNETNEDFVWEKGCLTDLHALYYASGNVAICILTGIIFFNCLSIYFATRLYSAIREAAGQKIDFHLATYLVDCFCCCRCCKHLPPIPAT